MSRKKKIKSAKKQFRLYDIYRAAAIGEPSNIEGITYYEVDKDASVITVHYDTVPYVEHYFARNEEDLRAIRTQVNSRLGNCRTPGRKRGRKW
jgi:hypothetical protein